MKGSWSNLLKINFVHLKSCLKNPGSQNSASKQVLKEGGNKELEKKTKKKTSTFTTKNIFKIIRNERTMPYKMRTRKAKLQYQACLNPGMWIFTGSLRT